MVKWPTDTSTSSPGTSNQGTDATFTLAGGRESTAEVLGCESECGDLGRRVPRCLRRRQRDPHLPHRLTEHPTDTPRKYGLTQAVETVWRRSTQMSAPPGCGS